MKVIIACAGTGGHINPGIAIANEVKKNEPESKILFLGTETGLENKLVPKAGYELKHIRAGRFYRKLTLKNIKNITNAYMGIYDAKKILNEFKPDVVVGTGGFICMPVMKAAKKLHIPYVLHESNAFPGLSVRVLSKSAEKVLLGFEAAKEKLEGKCIFTGSPTKFNMENMMKLDKTKCKEELNLTHEIQNKKVIFVTGGSQGARKFNQVVIDMVKKYKSEEFFVVIATGLKNYEETIESIKGQELDKYLRIVDYVYDMDKMYKASDLLITRAGALTVTEISIARRPAILIPLPYAAENHQLYNAKMLENAKAGIVIEESVLNEDLLYDKIISVMSDEEKLKQMGENAAKLYLPNVEERIYKEIKDIVKGE